ncbi:DUF6448 family protein [Clostridium algoriphilum]|uniref:DUF6448 family protein n=1 Tax=Clostridium algoriphilum TaxID=198347 RepID=UPI001CF3ECB4|nr:DUF6448 family protein [Clostridium algoriphilum]MCB2296099.1 DUF6448 family protein [Clostridium algoriphilum]
MKKFKKSKAFGSLLMALTIVIALPTIASAHCDTMDGPTVADGKKAMKTNNVNYVLKWAKPEYEKEISQMFVQTMKVKELSPEAKVLSEKYFLENLVRLHRAGEGAPFTGIKPSGTPKDEKVLAADESIKVGNLSSLEKLIEKDKVPELKERFEKAMALKNFDVNNVEAGRKYIESYVSFLKFAEGEEDHSAEAKEGHTAVTEQAESLPIIPWSLVGVFFITTLISGIAYHRKASK